jgi:hypothetical protein
LLIIFNLNKHAKILKKSGFQEGFIFKITQQRGNDKDHGKAQQILGTKRENIPNLATS